MLIYPISFLFQAVAITLYISLAYTLVPFRPFHIFNIFYVKTYFGIG